jgi:phosphate starvation-inducible membrane PsiE
MKTNKETIETYLKQEKHMAIHQMYSLSIHAFIRMVITTF